MAVRRLLALLASTGVLAVGAHVVSAQVCLPDTLVVNGYCNSIGNNGDGAVVGADTSRIITSYHDCSTDRSQQASYDLRAGTVFASAARHQYFANGFPAFGRVAVHETFWVLGPVPGAACSFHVSLDVMSRTAGGVIYGCQPPTHDGPNICTLPPGRATVSLEVEGQNPVAWDSDTTEGTFTPKLSIPLTLNVGDTFDLTVHVLADATEIDDFDYAVDPREASAFGQIVFRDLPEGFSISGCHGYAVGSIVPTRTTSWGRLKVRYR